MNSFVAVTDVTATLQHGSKQSDCLVAQWLFTETALERVKTKKILQLLFAKDFIS